MSNELKAMEARAVAAEASLAKVNALVRRCQDFTSMYIQPSEQSPDRAMHEMIYLLDSPEQREAQKAIDLTAARELMRKAEEWGKLETRVWDAHQRAFGARNYVYVDSHTTVDLLVADITATQHERDTLRRQLAEAEALVDAALHQVTVVLDLAFDAAEWAKNNGTVIPDDWHEAHSDIRTWVESPLTPAAALVEYRREVRRETRKELADYFDSVIQQGPVYLSGIAETIRAWDTAVEEKS